MRIVFKFILLNCSGLNICLLTKFSIPLRPGRSGMGNPDITRPEAQFGMRFLSAYLGEGHLVA